MKEFMLLWENGFEKSIKNSTPTGSKTCLVLAVLYWTRTLWRSEVQNKVHILSYILCFVSFQYLLWEKKYKHGGTTFWTLFVLLLFYQYHQCQYTRQDQLTAELVTVKPRCYQPSRMISSRLEHLQAAITRGSGCSWAEDCTRQCAAADPMESTHQSERRLRAYQVERRWRAPLFSWDRMSTYIFIFSYIHQPMHIRYNLFTSLENSYMFWHLAAILKDLQIQKEYMHCHINIGSVIPSY